MTPLREGTAGNKFWQVCYIDRTDSSFGEGVILGQNKFLYYSDLNILKQFYFAVYSSIL